MRQRSRRLMVTGMIAGILLLGAIAPVHASPGLFQLHQRSVQLAPFPFPFNPSALRPSTPPPTPTPAPGPVPPPARVPGWWAPARPAAPPPQATPDGTPGILADEQLLLQLANQERARLGLAPLQHHPELARLARIKAQDMVDNNYYAHTSPTLGTPWEMLRSAGITYRAGAENLTRAPTAAFAHTQFMVSPAHRAAILNPQLTHVGMGVVPHPRGGIMVCQLFIRP